jgi:hypothetical protein
MAVNLLFSRYGLDLAHSVFLISFIRLDKCLGSSSLISIASCYFWRHEVNIRLARIARHAKI